MRSQVQETDGSIKLVLAFSALALVAGAAAIAQDVAVAQEIAGAASRQTPQASAAHPPAQIAVSPGKFEVELGSQPVVESLKIINFGSREVDIRVSVATWDLDEDSRVRLLDPTEQSLDQSIVLNPGTFTLPAHGEQTVRFSIRPRTRPETGEHRAMLYFEEVPRQTPGGAAVQVRFKLGVAVYAYAGEVTGTGELQGLQVAADPGLLGAAFEIASLGNIHVRMKGQYAVWPLDAFPGIAGVALIDGVGQADFVPPAPLLMAGPLPSTPVLAGTRRQILLTGAHSLPPGRYVLAATGMLGDASFREAVEFSVPPIAAPAVAGQQDDAGS